MIYYEYNNACCFDSRMRTTSSDGKKKDTILSTTDWKVSVKSDKLQNKRSLLKVRNVACTIAALLLFTQALILAYTCFFCATRFDRQKYLPYAIFSTIKDLVFLIVLLVRAPFLGKLLHSFMNRSSTLNKDICGALVSEEHNCKVVKSFRSTIKVLLSNLVLHQKVSITLLFFLTIEVLLTETWFTKEHYVKIAFGSILLITIFFHTAQLSKMKELDKKYFDPLDPLFPSPRKPGAHTKAIDARCGTSDANNPCFNGITRSLPYLRVAKAEPVLPTSCGHSAMVIPKK